ncbi:MAG: F0F1 ATP synthase subunit A [Sumerlaeia bacterium]
MADNAQTNASQAPHDGHQAGTASVSGDVRTPASDLETVASASGETHGYDPHGEETHAAKAKADPEHPPELTNATWLFYEIMAEKEKDVDQHSTAYTVAKTLHKGRLQDPLPIFGRAPWENHLWFALAAFVLAWGMISLTKQFRARRDDAFRRPDRGQVTIEGIVSGMDSFTKGILGEHNGRAYLPYIGTIFLLILVMNLFGIVPFFKAPSSSFIITLSLAICTFLVTLYTGLVKLGPVKYVYHLMGSPTGVSWLLVPLFLVIELISEFLAKPLSLSLRLFGNILGKDILLGSFVMLGLMLTQAILRPFGLEVIGTWIGIPLHFPLLFLALILSTVQALVFAMLSAIYIMMMLPHDHDDHH